MAREISQTTRVTVIKLYFEGLAYDEIAKKLGIGKGSVAAIIDELKEGRFTQFESAVELVDNLREVTLGLRKLRITPAEGANLFILLRRLGGLGVEPAQLEIWVKMCQSVRGEELTGSQILQAAMKLAKLEVEGLSYEDAIEKLNSSSIELKDSEKKLEALQTKLAQLGETEQKMTRECQDLKSEKKRLETENRKINEKVQELSDRCQKLEKTAVDRQIAVAHLEEKNKDLSERLPLLEERAAAIEKEVNIRQQVLKELEDLGFSRKELEQLKASLAEMEQRYGKDGLATRFFDSISTYDSIVGLEGTREALIGEIDTLTKQRDALTQLGEKLKLTPDEVAEGIATLKALQRKGVTPSAIVSYQKVLNIAGIDPQSFQKLVTEFGGVEQTLRATRGELKAREQELEAKTRALEELKGEEAEVKASITTLKQSAVKEIKEIAISAKSEVDKLCQSMQQDIARWGNVRSEMGKCQEELKLARYFSIVPLSEQTLSNLVNDIGVPIVLQYLLIALAWCRTKFNPKQKPPYAITRKYYEIHDYTQVELVDIIRWALTMLAEGAGSDQRRA